MSESEQVKEISSGNFDEFVKDGKVVIDFFAEWCMPCLMMSPVVDSLAEKLQGKVKFGKVDISENQDIAKKYGITSIPNFVILNQGKIVDQIAGSLTEEELEERINKI